MFLWDIRLISKMLKREPEKRAALEDIMNDKWLQSAHPPLLPTPVPLVSALPLTPEEHIEVLNKMELGSIADRETIKR